MAIVCIRAVKIVAPRLVEDSKTCKLVAPVLARGWDHVKKTDHVLCRPCVYTCIHKALKASEEIMNSKSCLTYCIVQLCLYL